MNDILGMILVALVSYLIGSISFATIFSKKLKGIDPREHGSKNPGTTNVLRTAGMLPAFLTLIFDILKGVISVILAVFLAKWTKMEYGYLLVQTAALFVILGHMFPLYYKFKGGKGIATGLGVIFILNWQIGLIVLVFALTVMLLSRYVSLASISAVVLYFVLSIFLTDANIIEGPTLSFVALSILLALLIVFKHRENIKRLKNGEENKLSFKRNKVEQKVEVENEIINEDIEEQEEQENKKEENTDNVDEEE